MNIFQTAMISQVLFGVGARHAIGQTLTNMGTKKALIITDKFLHDSGLSNDVETSIKNAGIESIMFDGAEPENSLHRLIGRKPDMRRILWRQQNQLQTESRLQQYVPERKSWMRYRAV